MLYQCCPEWEHSRYDDSDFYTVVYDSEKDECRRYETWTTRFPSGSSPLPQLTPEIAPKALSALARVYQERLTRRITRQITEPEPSELKQGMRVRFSTDHRCMRKDKTIAREECSKCGGSGKWTNPYKPSDVRQCFACTGEGERNRTKRVRAKDADGSQAWESIKTGACGEIIAWTTFGTFYRNGHNRPNRSNTTVYVRLDDGREVQAPLAKLQEDREIPPGDKIRAMAEDYATRQGFYPPFATSHVAMI